MKIKSTSHIQDYITHKNKFSFQGKETVNQRRKSRRHDLGQTHITGKQENAGACRLADGERMESTVCMLESDIDHLRHGVW